MSGDKFDDDDEVPQLSAETLKALQEFYAESQASLENLKEDWQLSQFWYDKNTSETLTKEVLTLAFESKRPYKIACISCPTLFKTLHNYLKDLKSHPDFRNLNEETSKQIEIKLFEYDKRFELYGHDFQFYDYKEPLGVNQTFEKYFDLVIADPPFLSDECQIKTGMTIRKVGKDNMKLIICTGAVMEELLAASLKVKLCSFIPKHENNLANEFKCYSNYEAYFLNK